MTARGAGLAAGRGLAAFVAGYAVACTLPWFLDALGDPYLDLRRLPRAIAPLVAFTAVLALPGWVALRFALFALRWWLGRPLRFLADLGLFALAGALNAVGAAAASGIADLVELEAADFLVPGLIAGLGYRLVEQSALRALGHPRPLPARPA